MKNRPSRRELIRTGGFVAGSLLADKAIMREAQVPNDRAQPVPASDRVRFGIIGVGMQGSGLLANAISLPGIECVGAAYLYDGPHTLAKEITGNPSLPASRRYRSE